MKIHMGSKIQLSSFLTSELDEDDWSGSHSCLFAPEKTLAVLTVLQTQPVLAVRRREVSCPCQELKDDSLVVQTEGYVCLPRSAHCLHVRIRMVGAKNNIPVYLLCSYPCQCVSTICIENKILRIYNVLKTSILSLCIVESTQEQE
jgi:hypothetical protein